MHGFNLYFVIDDHILMFPNAATPCVCGAWFEKVSTSTNTLKRLRHGGSIGWVTHRCMGRKAMASLTMLVSWTIWNEQNN